MCAGAALAAAAVFRRMKKKNAALAALGLCMGFIWNSSWQALFLRQARQLDGTRAVVEAEVLDWPQCNESGGQAEVRVGRTKCILYMYDKNYIELTPGDMIETDAKFRMRDADNHYMAQGIPLFAYAQGAPKVVGTAPFSLTASGALIRARLGAVLTEIYSERSAPFMKALLLGDRRELKDDVFTYSMMKNAGVSHCVAVSGMHVSILVGLIYLLLGKRRFAAVACMPVTVLFMAVTGFAPSVVRAGIMQIALCISALIRREYDSRTSLMLALAALLAINPCSIKNAALQLSFAASLGIILFYNRFNVIKIKYVGDTLAVTAGALIFTVPIMAVTFGSVSVIAPITNLLVLWAVSLCFSLGIFSAGTGMISAVAGKLLAVVPELLAEYIRRVTKLCGMLPFASVGTDGLAVKLWLAVLYGLLIWFLLDRRKYRKALIFTCVYVAGAAAVMLAGRMGSGGDRMRFAALDVGQGQCVVFTTKTCTAVIDCGGNSYDNPGDIAADYLQSMGRQRIDLLVFTHFHEDHINGAIELMKRMRVSELIVCEGNDTGITQYASHSEGALVTRLSGGPKEVVCGDMSFLIIPPREDSEENEKGLCVLASYNDYDVLITGDMSRDGELDVLGSISVPDIEVLMVGHHGSSTSCSAELLEQTRPEAAIISVGRNSYGHPTQAVLDRINEAGAACFRTDELGNVVIYDR